MEKLELMAKNAFYVKNVKSFVPEELFKWIRKIENGILHLVNVLNVITAPIYAQKMQ